MQPAALLPAPLPSAPFAPAPEPARGANGAGWRLWGVFAFFFLSLLLGINWDRVWHTTHPFEGFFSPPHIFLYTTATLSAALVGVLAWSPRLRGWYGPLVRHRLLFGTVSGAVAITGVGLVLLAFAGLVLDNAWHTRFGLDETPWSTPHAMIGWCIMVVGLGFVAARLGLRAWRPLGGVMATALGWLVFALTLAPVFGPFRQRHTPEELGAAAAALHQFPSLFAGSNYDHVLRIEQVANLTRTNPASVLLGALWVGFALAIVRGLHRSPWPLLAAAALWSLGQALGDWSAAGRLVAFGLAHPHELAQWLPFPLLPAACALLLLERPRLPFAVRWAAVGLIYALCAAAVWGRDPLWLVAIPSAALVCVGGAWLGGRVLRLLEAPTARGVLAFTPLLCILGPLCSGAVDLWLRGTIQ